MARPSPLWIVLLLPACPSGSDPEAGPNGAKTEVATPPATDVQIPAGTETGPQTQDAKPPRQKPADLPAAEVAKLRKTFRAKLDEGRKQTKAGKHEAGIALYNEALAIEPTNPAALAELGWAAFQANQLDLAQGATSQALTFSRKPEQQGMILYNLGRVAEARGRIDDAIHDYRESLARRSNKTVQSRLDGLLAAATTPVPTPSKDGLRPILTGVTDLAEACKQLVIDECDNLYTVGEDTCKCEAIGDEGPFVLLEIGEGDLDENSMWYPAVETSAGWTVFDVVGTVYNPGAFGIWEEATWDEKELVDLIPGGSLEWVLAFSKSRTDSDMGLNEFEDESYAMTMVCAIEGANAWCTEPLMTSSSYSRDVQFPDEEAEAEDEPIDHTGLPIDRRFSCMIELGATVTVDGATGDVGEVLGGNARTLADGEYDLATLLGK